MQFYAQSNDTLTYTQSRPVTVLDSTMTLQDVRNYNREGVVTARTLLYKGSTTNCQVYRVTEALKQHSNAGVGIVQKPEGLLVYSQVFTSRFSNGFWYIDWQFPDLAKHPEPVRFKVDTKLLAKNREKALIKAVEYYGSSHKRPKDPEESKALYALLDELHPNWIGRG